MQHDEIVRTVPDLKKFAQHGVVFETLRAASAQAIGNCPLCGKHEKFWCNVKNLLWDCKSCGASGNWESFMGQASVSFAENAPDEIMREASTDRHLRMATLKAFGFGVSSKSCTYPAKLPSAAGDWRVTDLRRWSPGRRPMASSGGKTGLIVPAKLRGTKKVWVCEGEWDSMAWWEILRKLRIKDDVVGVCGAGNFPKKAADFFTGKQVVLLFDCDEPGRRGALRTWKILDGVAAAREALQWPAKYPDGYDIRDLYVESGHSAIKCQKMVEKNLVRNLIDPDAHEDGSTPAVAASTPEADIDPHGKGMAPKDVLTKYRKSLIIKDTTVLDVMFGAVFANRIEADPLWMFFVAPSGGSKSEFLMSLATAPLIHCVTTLTPHSLISGMNTGAGDPSLLPKIIGKTMVVKDFASILSMNVGAKEEIFGLLRDAYDGHVSKMFGNGVTRVYEGKFGILGGVTPAIDDPRNSMGSLGERFIKYRIQTHGRMHYHEDSIMKAIENITHEGAQRSKMVEVGRAVLDRPVSRSDYPTMPRWFKIRVAKLAQWVGNMRGCVVRERYTQNVSFRPTAEIGTRLAKQLCILALGIGVYRGVSEIDEEIYQIIAKVGVDTAPCKIESVTRSMYVIADWATTSEIAAGTRFPEETVRHALQDLNMLHVVDKDKNAWKLSEEMMDVMKELALYESQ